MARFSWFSRNSDSVRYLLAVLFTWVQNMMQYQCQPKGQLRFLRLCLHLLGFRLFPTIRLGVVAARRRPCQSNRASSKGPTQFTAHLLQVFVPGHRQRNRNKTSKA